MSLARLAEAGGPGALGVAHPFAPDSAYAVSKIFGEMLGKYHATRDATVARDFEFVALRIGWCAYDDPGALEGTVHDEYLPVRLVGWSHNKSKNKDISHVGNAFVIVRRPADRHILAAHRNEGKQNEGKHPQAHAGAFARAAAMPKQCVSHRAINKTNKQRILVNFSISKNSMALGTRPLERVPNNVS